MPPAAEVASERARLAAAERALRELRAPAAAPALAPAADDDEGEVLLDEDLTNPSKMRISLFTRSNKALSGV